MRQNESMYGASQSALGPLESPSQELFKKVERQYIPPLYVGIVSLILTYQAVE